MRKDNLDFELIRQLPVEIDETRMNAIVKGLPVAAATFSMMGVAKFINLNSILITLVSAVALTTATLGTSTKSKTDETALPARIEAGVKPTTQLPKADAFEGQAASPPAIALSSPPKVDLKELDKAESQEAPVIRTEHKKLNSIAKVDIDVLGLLSNRWAHPGTRSYVIDPSSKPDPYRYIFSNVSNMRNAIRVRRDFNNP